MFFHCQSQQKKWGLTNLLKEVFTVYINFTPSIYGNSRLETYRRLALSLSDAYDSSLVGSQILHQGQGNSLRYLHLQLIQGTLCFLFSLMAEHAFHVPGPPMYLCSVLPLFGKSGVEEERDMATDWTLVAFPFISSSLPPIRNAGSGPILAVFVIVLGEANLTMYTSEKVCASAGWTGNCCRLFSADCCFGVLHYF